DCIDYQRGPVCPVRPIQESATREQVFACPYFRLWRIRSQGRFRVGAAGECRMVIALEGEAELQYRGQNYPLKRGSLLLLPAEVGPCESELGKDAVILEAGFGKLT